MLALRFKAVPDQLQKTSELIYRSHPDKYKHVSMQGVNTSQSSQDDSVWMIPNWLDDCLARIVFTCDEGVDGIRTTYWRP